MKMGNYIPGTETTRRRPTPDTYAHLRTWIDVDTHFIDITNITDLKNIDVQLEQSAKLYVSNVISRVIAQLIGATADGFVTLEATDDGELKVQVASGTSEIGSLAAGSNVIGNVGLEAGTEEIGKLAAGSALIGKFQIEGSSQTVLNAVINFATAATHSIIAAVSGKKIKITNIMLTVAGETNLTLKSSTTAISGALDFGGTDEPRGMAHHLGDHPLETLTGNAFQITSSGAVQVSGYVTYYAE